MNIVNIFNGKDIFKILTEKLSGLDVNYRRAVIFGFLTCLIAYGFQLTHVVMSPDMYQEITTYGHYPINYSGRWFMAFLRNVVLYDHRIVPTFNLLISLVLFIFSSLLVLKIWRVTRPLYIYFVIVIITANTYTCHILRWENAHVEASLTTFIAVLALYWSGRGLKIFFPALILMACAHGGYQTGVSFGAATLFAGFAFWIFQDGDFKNLSGYVKTKLLPGFLVLAGGFLLHRVILNLLLDFFNLREGSRLHTSHIPNSIGEFIGNIYDALISIPSLFSHQVIYFNFQITVIYKIFFVLFSATIFVFLWKERRIKSLLLVSFFLLICFLTLMSVYLPMIVIGYKWMVNRILYPVAIFHALVIVVVLSGRSLLLRNLGIVSCFVLVFFFAWHNNMYSYRSFVQDRADFELASRIISRIEGLPEFEQYAEKSLKLTVIGTKDIAIPGYRFSSWRNAKVLRRGAFERPWSAVGIFAYQHFSQTPVSSEKFQAQGISKKMAEAILKMEDWPSRKSVAIVDGMAIVILDKTEIPKNVNNILFSNAEKKYEFVVLPNNPSFKPIYQISSFSPNGDLVVSGHDPQMSFELPKPQKDTMYIMRVRLNAPVDTLVQLFYKSSSSPSFTEKKSLRCMANAGQNECYFLLDGNMFDGNLRLDPGTVAGQYKIKDIVIREVAPSLGQK